MRTPHRLGILAFALVVLLAAGLYPATAARQVEARAQRTVSCSTLEGALQLWAFATNPETGSANVTISTGNPNFATGLLGVSSTQPRYGLDPRCHTVSQRVALSRHGLTSAGVVHAGDIQSPTVYCAATRRVLIRLLISYNGSQKPVSATIEVLTQPKAGSGRKSKRIAYLQWSPQKSVTYYSSACTSQY